MGTVVFSISQAGFSTVSKTTTWADADLTRLTSSYQSEANISINGTATRSQVLNYIVTNVWTHGAISHVKTTEAQSAIAAVPPPADIPIS